MKYKTGLKKWGYSLLWVLFTFDNEYSVYQVKLLKQWYDKVNNNYPITCQILKVIHGKSTVVDNNTICDHEWQLQSTLEDLYRITIKAIIQKWSFCFLWRIR